METVLVIHALDRWNYVKTSFEIYTDNAGNFRLLGMVGGQFYLEECLKIIALARDLLNINSMVENGTSGKPR